MSKLTPIAHYYNLPDAYLSKARLEAEGIECVLGNEHLMSMNWLYSVATGGVELCVWEKDAARALAILESLNSAEFDLDELTREALGEPAPGPLLDEDNFTVPAGEFSTPAGAFDTASTACQPAQTCARCGSSDIAEDNHAKGFAAAGMLIGLPLPITWRHFRCRNCNRTWRSQAS